MDTDRALYSPENARLLVEKGKLEDGQLQCEDACGNQRHLTSENQQTGGVGRSRHTCRALSFVLLGTVALACVLLPRGSRLRSDNIEDTKSLNMLASKADDKDSDAKVEAHFKKLYSTTFKGKGMHIGLRKSDHGVCGFEKDWIPKGMRTVALNTLDSFGTRSCGMCIKVYGEEVCVGGKGGSCSKNPISEAGEVFFVNNLCPNCGSDNLGLVLKETQHRDIPLSWKAVPCPLVKEGVSYRLEGSNQYYVKMRPFGANFPIAKMEVKVNRKWIRAKLPDYGYYFEKNNDDGTFNFPLHVRITSVKGEILTDTITKLTAKPQHGARAVQFKVPATTTTTTMTTTTRTTITTTTTTTLDLKSVFQSCHTAIKGEKCHSAVVWAKSDKGIGAHPKWFKGLTNSSTFEDFQLHLHTDPNSKKSNCPKPCPACHTAVKGEKCHKSIDWARSGGIAKHREWFPGVAPDASFEEVQLHYHRHPKSDASCPLPCLPGPCHTAVKGEECYSAVNWAKETGVIQHPAWFKGLSNTSSFEEFQLHLHEDPNAEVTCPSPCM